MQFLSHIKRVPSFLLCAIKAPLVIGGQAVVEGVMMKSRHHTATAVRVPGGKIVVGHRRERSFTERHGLNKVPLVRGVFVLFETMVIGMRELNWSANRAIGEERGESSSWALAGVLGMSVLLGLAIFKLLPLFLAAKITGSLGGGNLMLNVLDGAIKLAIFVLYVAAISLMPDVRRLFTYHGAEHKSVNCYEAGGTLTPREAKRHTLKQPRCGTTFVVYVFVLSIIVYMFIPFGESFWAKLGLRILLLPLIAGIAYEWIRLAGRYYSNSWLVRAISVPGMAVQSLTTREPDAAQLEVALAALKRVLKEEGINVAHAQRRRAKTIS